MSLKARPAETAGNVLLGLLVVRSREDFLGRTELHEFGQILRAGYRVGVGTRTLQMSVHHPPAAPGKNFGRAYVKQRAGLGTTAQTDMQNV